MVTAEAQDAQVEYEASDPDVIGVGGTSLHLDRTDGRVLSETGWTDSGGGISTAPQFVRPTWQPPYVSINSNLRLVPDVSAVADPVPGVFVWLSGSEWRINGGTVGGTSWSTPIWAGFCALIAEAREKAGKTKLGFLGPRLYRPQSVATFRDITTGSNGKYTAAVGWNPNRIGSS